MQVSHFIQYIDDTAQLSKASEDELLPILKEFPYCQTSHLMYAIQLNKNDNLLFDKQLKRAASICADRDKLFQSIHYSTNDTSSKTNTPPQQDLELNHVVENAKTLASAKNEAQQNAVLEEFETDDQVDSLDVLEKEYLTEAINHNLVVDFKTTEEAPLTTKDAQEEVSEEVELFNEAVAHSFSSWLHHYNGDLQPNSPQPKQNKQHLIDQFIQEDPTIKPQETPFYSPTKMARKSVADEGIVSETLAVVHVGQGNFQEAINTYEKLILKNPKKRSYFATQIKILKQKLK